MGTRVERGRRRRVPQVPLYGLHARSLVDQHARCVVAQIVRCEPADARLVGCSSPEVAESVPADRIALRVGEDQTVRTEAEPLDVARQLVEYRL